MGVGSVKGEVEKGPTEGAEVEVVEEEAAPDFILSLVPFTESEGLTADCI